MTSYTAVGLVVTALLLIGIRPGAWGLLRFILAVHLLGDVLFGWVWELMPTYAFMKYIDDADRIYAALFLGLAVIITDSAYRLTRRIQRLLAARFGLQASPLAKPAAPTEGFASAFLIAGLLCKLIFLGATGVLTGARSLAELQPSDSIGLGAIVMLADFLVPYGTAALRRSGRAPWPVIGDLFILAAVSFLSFSKAGFINYGLVYAVAFLLGEGGRRTRREFLNWKSVLVVGIAFLSLGIKSQQRAGLLVDLGSSVMTEQAMTGASARFMGGVFRAYSVALREVRHGWPPLGGAYHGQAALLVVPRALWPDKPHVAAERLYYLLGVTEEAYGTAFAINLYGCLVFDFGLAGCLLGAAVVGVLLQFGDASIPSWRQLARASPNGGRWHFFATMWVYLAVLLSEGGIPVAIVSAIGLTGAFIAIQIANAAAYSVLAAARAPSRNTATSAS
jgi:hypothetical protein